MAKSKGGARLGWLWLMLSLMVLVGVFLLSVAAIFPNGIELRKPTEAAAVPQPDPIEQTAIYTNILNVIEDPSLYFDQDIVAVVRIMDITTDRTMWISGREDASFTLFAVVAPGIDLSAGNLRIYQLIKVYATVRQVEGADMSSHGITLGPRTAQALTREQGYLLIRGVVPVYPSPNEMIPYNDEITPPPDEILPPVDDADEYSYAENEY